MENKLFNLAGLLVMSMAILSGFLAGQYIPRAQTSQSQSQVLSKTEKSKNGCTTIQDGVLETTDGRVIEPGFDEWGYNYQARIFNSGYCDAYRDAAWCQAYKNVDLIMKWNDAWLSNKDCDDDGLLDRYYGHASYIGSGAWLTNHQSESYVDENDKEQMWNYFVKIIAVPADAKLVDGIWYTVDREEIGEEIWGSFATIQQIYNDTGTGEHGVEYRSPVGPGFGKWK